MRANWLARILSLALVYFLQVALAVALVDPITQWVDDTLPGAFFYHLHSDESPGPIGDPVKFLFMVFEFPLAFYCVFFVPIGRGMGMRSLTLALLAIANEPIVAVLFLLVER